MIFPVPFAVEKSTKQENGEGIRECKTSRKTFAGLFSTLGRREGKLVNYIIICLIAGEENMMEDPPCIVHIWNGSVGQVSEQDVCCVERCVKNGFVSNVMCGNNMEKYGFTEDCEEEMYKT